MNQSSWKTVLSNVMIAGNLSLLQCDITPGKLFDTQALTDPCIIPVVPNRGTAAP